MFKRAYCRGIQSTLIQSGKASYPDEQTAAKVADYIADRTDFDVTAAVPQDKIASIATNLIEASDYFKKQGAVSGSFAKIASVEDLSKLAHVHALDLMQKAAEGSTLEGGDKGNKEMSSGEAKMDASARPEGYAHTGPGNTAVDTKPGAIGKEEDQPAKQNQAPSGSNSAVEQTRSASLQQLIAKIAEGTTLLGGDKGNKDMSSSEAKMDASVRPEGYAKLPGQGDLGALMAQLKGPAVIGRETANPAQQHRSPSGSNSLAEQTAKAAADAADPFVTLFKKTAGEVAQYLPKSFTEEKKIAHVRACMGMTNLERAHYLTSLQKEAVDKTSGEMPDFIKEKMKGEGTSEEKAEKKDDEKKDEEKKEASLADHFRRIAATVNA